MSKDKLSQYSSAAGSNTDIGGISIAEGMLPSNVNNALREQMSHLADFAAGTSGVNVLKLQDDTDTNSIKIQAPASVTATTTFTLPDGDGSANQSLVTNGSGTLSFSTRLANVVEDTTPQLGGDLDTNGNDINFGDNDKAIFGAGSDLQIYHDGLNSFIKDAGTGNLTIQAEDFAVQSSDGSATHIFVDSSSGYTALSFGGTTKLNTTNTGVDVTGTVTADDTLQVDGNQPKVKIVETDASTTHEVFSAGGNLYVAVDSSSVGSKNIIFRNNGTTQRMRIADGGDISFYDNTGVTQGLYWDASTQRLGLGTTTPDRLLDIESNVPVIRLTDTTTSGLYHEILGDGDSLSIEADDGNVGSSSSINFKVGGTPRMTIDSSGNVGIGTTTPDTNAEIFLNGSSADGLLLSSNNASTSARLFFQNATAGEGYAILQEDGDLDFRSGATAGVSSGTQRMTITSGGNVGIGIASVDEKLDVNGNVKLTGTGRIIKFDKNGSGEDNAIYYDNSTASNNLFIGKDSSNLAFRTGGTERMRIDASGNVGIETTTTTRAKLNIDTDGTNTSAGYGISLTNTAGGGSTWTLQCGDHAVDNGAFTIRETGISGTTYLKLGSGNGYLTAAGVYALTTASSANVNVDANGALARSTSSMRYKNTINDATHGLTELLALRPVTYKGNNNGDTIFGGLIAEEVHDAGLTEFVEYDDEGRPDALAYGNMVSLCIKAIQEQQATITALEARIAALEAN